MLSIWLARFSLYDNSNKILSRRSVRVANLFNGLTVFGLGSLSLLKMNGSDIARFANLNHKLIFEPEESLP